MSSKIRILVTGGGTGGHIIPTLAVIEELKKLDENIDLLYVGAGNGMEAGIVPKKGIAFKGIYCGKLRRYFSWENFTDIFRVIAGFFQSLHIVYSFKPHVIFAKGGYVTVPVGLAGGLLRIPMVVHESDTVLGLSNRILFRFIHKLSLGFPPQNYPPKVRNKGEYTGSPVNPEIFKSSSISKEEAGKHFDFNPSMPVLLVTGGSQGARAINQSVSAILEELEKIQILHLCGKPDYPWLSESMNKLPAELKKRYRLFEFLSEDMPKALLCADLVLTRGGANTLCELSVLKKPSVIIPLPKSGNDHQKKNARVFTDMGASVMIDQADLTTQLLLETINGLFSHPARLREMSEKAASLAKPEAALSVARTILKLKGIYC